LLTTNFTLGEQRIDPGGNQICRPDKVVQVEPKAMAVLCVLASNPGETISREDLLGAVWPGRVVVEETLTRAISQLRTALQDEVAKPRFIQTVPKQGYRLIAPVGHIPRQQPVDSPGDTGVQHEPTPELPPDPESRRGQANRLLPGLLAICLVGTGLVYWLGAGPDDEPTPREIQIVTSSVAVVPAKPSVAVLPFRNLSPDAEDEYFAAGITEELLTALASVEGLRVPSRRSSFAFKGKTTDLATIAAQLNVRHVLEGGVRRSGDTLRITAQLIDTGTDSTVWSQQYDRPRDSIFTVQQEIAGNVINALRGTLLGQAAIETRITRSDSLEAYNLYLQGQYWWMTGQVSSWFYQARDSFERAIELDPQFADAHAALAYIYARFNFQDDYLPAEEARPRAERAIETALALDSSAVDAYFARAILATGDGRYASAHKDLDKALALRPNSSTAHALYSEVWLAENQPEQATAAAARALDLDPLSPWTNVNMGIVLFSVGRWNEAIVTVNRARELDPQYSWAHMWIAVIEHARGNLARAVKAMHRCVAIDPASETNAAYLGQLYLELGDTTRAQKWLEYAASLQGDSSSSRLWRSYIGLVYEQQGPEVFLDLARDSSPLETPTYSLVPALHAALVRSGGGSEGIAMLEALHPALKSDKPMVNILSARTAVALAHMYSDQERSAQLIKASREAAERFPAMFGWQGIDVELLALEGRNEEAITALKNSFKTGWRANWWMLEHSPSLIHLRDHPEFRDILVSARSKADEQRRLVLVLERQGELGPVPFYGNN
jgi:TolB-like protein/DNA-binding winged helix-turn-helix (wHTH) protein/Tfp pilus assembly protein PilF